MSDENANIHFEAALSRFLDGEPEPGDGELIAGVLRESPEKLREVSGLAAVDDLLRQNSEPGKNSFVEGLVQRLEADASASRFVHRLKKRLGSPDGQSPAAARTWLPWALTLAACVVAALGWWRSVPHASPTRPDTARIAPATQPSDSMALLVNQAQAKFAEGAAPEAVSFAKGHYSLIEGSAHLRFRTGADVVIVAPTQFTIDDAMRMRLESGTLRALVPVSAHGFVVLAPGVQFRDLGTEFGVKVKPNASTSELHVFDGQVEVYHDGMSKPQRTVLGGESVKMVEGVLEPAGAAEEGEFPTAGSISLSRWNGLRKQFRVDPNLVLYYPFIPDAMNASLLNDDAEHADKVQGHITGAKWVTGRWPGKKALQFEEAGDSVSLEIPGEFDQVTLAAWLKIDRIEDAENTIMSSVGWHKGGVQWQFNRRASVASTAVFSEPKRRVLWARASLPLGQWVHWAVTIDRQTGKILHYVDGKPVCEAQIAPMTTIIQPGPSHLGRWDCDKPMPERRDFRGRIDELAMWRVSLPPERISKLADEGMPVELPESPEAGSSSSR